MASLLIGANTAVHALTCDTFGFPATVAGVHSALPLKKGYHTMSDLRNRMMQDLKMAGLVEGTQRKYLRAVRQLAAYYMIPPDRLTERQVQNYILYVRDNLGVAKGTFEPLFSGLKFFYLNTLDYNWALFTKKKYASHARAGCPTSAATMIAAA
jgi:hypothetical protein